MKEREKDTWEQVVDAVEAERLKHATILNYILNVNSHPMPRGMDYKKLIDDLQDYENYLFE